jgi:uncharacterized RDD family membrane protein YckC
MQPRLDTVVRVETPEGITLPLRCAGAIVRSHAFAIDALIRLVIAIAAGAFLSMFEGLGTALNLLLLFALEWFYPVLFEMGARGATPGKRAMGLRVVMDDGMPPTLAASLLRNLLRVVDFLPFAYAAGVLSMLLRRDFKRLGDIAAGTRVIHDRPSTLHAAAPPDGSTTPSGPALPLTAAQQTAVVDWALRTPRLTPARAEELAVLAAPVLPAGPGTPGQRLLSLAHWALGHR